jgi:hypothetical protein
MYYSCGATPAASYVTFIFAQASMLFFIINNLATMYMGRIDSPNPAGAFAGTFNLRWRTFSRGSATKPITAVFARFSKIKHDLSFFKSMVIQLVLSHGIRMITFSVLSLVMLQELLFIEY